LPLACFVSFQAPHETDPIQLSLAAQRALQAKEKAALKLASEKAEADDDGPRTDDATDTGDGVSSCIFLRC
jgi:hypothetical protein